MHHELLTALRPYEQSVALIRSFIALSIAYGVRATSPSQSNAVQCKGTQNSAATFSYTPAVAEFDEFVAVTERGVKIKVLTNSLRSSWS
jgi:hypothetical protein